MALNKKKLNKQGPTTQPTRVITVVLKNGREFEAQVMRDGKVVEGAVVAIQIVEPEGASLSAYSPQGPVQLIRALGSRATIVGQQISENVLDTLFNFVGEIREALTEDEEDEGEDETLDSEEGEDEETDEPEAPKPLAPLEGCIVPGCPVAGGCGREDCPGRVA